MVSTLFLIAVAFGGGDERMLIISLLLTFSPEFLTSRPEVMLDTRNVYVMVGTLSYGKGSRTIQYCRPLM